MLFPDIVGIEDNGSLMITGAAGFPRSATRMRISLLAEIAFPARTVRTRFWTQPRVHQKDARDPKGFEAYNGLLKKE